MLIPRVIPCLLLHHKGLVKTINFRDPKYLGDPINIVRIFNDKEVDELIFLDISASSEGKKPQFDLLRSITSECFMPVCYGGGIKTLEDIKTLFSLGVEKISLNSAAIENPVLISQAADIFGSQAIVAAIDVKSSLFGGPEVYVHLQKKNTRIHPVAYAQQVEKLGAGEILINSVDRDGTMDGYDIDLIRKIAEAVSIPVIACGGAGKLQDFRDAISLGGAAAVAAGSFFVFQGKHRAVLISYPERRELEKLFS
jgi:imidazole glycerol-phosphate synthase subunit HisF